MKRTAKFRKHPPPRSPAPCTSTSTTTTACRSSGARGRTGCLPCLGRRSESRGNIVEQSVDIVPVVQLLHVPVPHQVDSVVEVLKILDKSLPDVEQVIEVPKILQQTVLHRSSLQEPQLAEQLVEVSTPSPALVPVPQMEHQMVEVLSDRASACWVFRGCRWVRVAAASGAYGGLLVEGGLLSHPVAPPTWVHSPGQGGIQILALGDVDVPVIMLFVFQQSKSYVYCAAIQFIDRVPDQLCHRREIPQCSS